MSIFEYISKKISLHTVRMAQKSACDDNELTLEGQQPTIDDLNFHIYIKMKSFFENVTFFSSKDCQHARQVYLPMYCGLVSPNRICFLYGKK